MKTLCSNCISHDPNRHRTEHCTKTLLIGSLPTESSSVCRAHPRYVPTRHSEKLRARLISLHNERLIDKQHVNENVVLFFELNGLLVRDQSLAVTL
jgi:hypothetical protein